MTKRLKFHQKGAVLLLLFMVLFVFGSSIYLSSASHRPGSFALETETRLEVVKAKEALLAYAMNYPDFYNEGPGRLPCQDGDNDDVADPGCGDEMGRLPVSITLPSGSPYQLASHNHGIDQQFWYRANASFKATSAVLNTSSSSNFIVGGESDIVAVIIVPGAELSGQSRSTDNTDPTNYLEAGNASGTAFVTGSDPETLNDTVLPITKSELMSLAAVRVAQTVKERLDNFHETYTTYYSNSYPHYYFEFSCCYSYIYLSEDDMFSQAMIGAPTWYTDNQWDVVIDYTYVSANEARLSFNGCSMVFTVRYPSGMTRAPTEC